MVSLLHIANRLADPKLKAACERIVAHPAAIPEAKATAQSTLKLIEAEAQRRQNMAARSNVEPG